ncbi:MAG: hypothetical protein ACI9AT_001217 [Ulvibacter sp.]|jgi:hypothetical protein
MTKIRFLLFFLFLSGWTYGQNMDPSIMASDGGIDSTDQISLEWTLGEVAVATLYGETKMITEGYHQPSIVVSDYDDTQITNTANIQIQENSISVVPNPVKSIVSVQMQFPEVSEIYVSLFNLEGKQILKTFKKGSTDSFEMNLIDLSSGLYLLRFANPKGKILRTFKLSKIN